MRAITKRLVGLALILLVSACGGGGGGGGGGEPSDDGTPEDRLRIVRTDPEDGEHFVGQDDFLVVVFSDAVDTSTLEGHVRLVGPNGQVPATGTLGDTDRVLTITPTDRMTLASDYTVILDASVASRDGETLRKSRSFSFQTVLSPTPRIPRPEDFEVLPPLAVGRSHHSATLLDDGLVLVVGGFRDGSLVTPTAEVYDPEEKIFEPGPSLASGRARHTATRLDDGRVLIVGGESIRGVRAVAECEAYDPSTGEFEPVGSLRHARTDHRAEILDDGRVVVFGGTAFDGAGGSFWLDVAEVFDPGTGLWSELPDRMVRGRTQHTSTVLEDGRILLAGGDLDQSAEIFDPATMSFSRTPGDMRAWRFGHTAVLLEDGFVLMSGGGEMQGELYEPSSGRFLETSNGLRFDRFRATATPIPDGGVLVVGGIYFGDPSLILASMDLFARSQAPSGAYFHVDLILPDPMAAHTATTLEDGSILFTGGINPDTTQPEMPTALLFAPGE